MTRIRKILHLDLDAFFCAVEELRNPSLAGKAFAVGGKADRRGVIASCSYAARKAGVHSAMPTGQALRLCPNLVMISGNHGNYSEKSDQVMAILNNLSGLVEQISIDEAFVDVSDLRDDLNKIASDLQNEVMRGTNLPCSIGGASNKLVAKIATDTAKARSRTGSYPQAILIVEPGSEAAFLAPLPLKAMWGIGPKMETSLKNLGYQTLGDIAATPIKILENRFGSLGRELFFHCQGIDDRPVVVEHEAKSVSQETTFSRDTNDLAYLKTRIRELSAKVGFRLRAEGVCARVIRLKLRWSDFSTHSRQVALLQPTDQDGTIAETAERLLMTLWQSDRLIRLIGVCGADLVESAHQMGLWENPTDKERKLLGALDELRDRFGQKAVIKGNKVKPIEKST
jgi:DNA polymerase-4